VKITRFAVVLSSPLSAALVFFEDSKTLALIVKDNVEPMWSISGGRTSSQRRPQCLRGDLNG